jgi:hypothetical protein
MNKYYFLFFCIFCFLFLASCRDCVPEFCVEKPLSKPRLLEQILVQQADNTLRDTFVPASIFRTFPQMRLLGDTTWRNHKWTIKTYLSTTTIPYTDPIILAGSPTTWQPFFAQNVHARVLDSAEKPSDCIKDISYRGLDSQTIDILHLGQVPRALVGRYIGKNTSATNTFEVVLRLDSSLNGTSYDYLYRLSGLPSTCPQVFSRLDCGHLHFSILEGDNTQIGCEGLQGFGKLSEDRDSLYIWYAYWEDLNAPSRVSYFFQGKKQ